MSTPSCSNGSNGLITRFKYQDLSAMWPEVGALTQTGWNSINCGKCMSLTSEGQTAYFTVIDDRGMPNKSRGEYELAVNLSPEEFKRVFGTKGIHYGYGDADVQEVDPCQCKGNKLCQQPVNPPVNPPVDPPVNPPVNPPTPTSETPEPPIVVPPKPGTLVGDESYDTFFIQNQQIKDVLFVEITKQEGAIFQDGDFDGIVGLSFPSLSEGVATLSDKMKEQNLINKNVFSFYMNRYPQSSTSFVQFGDANYKDLLLDGQINYHKVVNPSFWSIYVQQILVDGNDTGVCSQKKPCAFVVDSGTSVIAGPSEGVNKLVNFIQNEDYQCTKMPKISFIIDEQVYNLHPDDYALNIQSDDVYSCIESIVQIDVQDEKLGDLWILGDSFMYKYYTIFDRENEQVGFAKLKEINQKLYL